MNDTVKINLLKVFEVAYQEMMEDKSEAPSSENLWKRYEKHLKVAVDATGNGIMHHLRIPVSTPSWYRPLPWYPDTA